MYYRACTGLVNSAPEKNAPEKAKAVASLINPAKCGRFTVKSLLLLNN
jgi:hypothetical protein